MRVHQDPRSDHWNHKRPTWQPVPENSSFRSGKLLEIRSCLWVLEWSCTDDCWLCWRIQNQPWVQKLGWSCRIYPGWSSICLLVLDLHEWFYFFPLFFSFWLNSKVGLIKLKLEKIIYKWCLFYFLSRFRPNRIIIVIWLPGEKIREGESLQFAFLF